MTNELKPGAKILGADGTSEVIGYKENGYVKIETRMIDTVSPVHAAEKALMDFELSSPVLMELRQAVNDLLDMYEDSAKKLQKRATSFFKNTLGGEAVMNAAKAAVEAAAETAEDAFQDLEDSALSHVIQLIDMISFIPETLQKQSATLEGLRATNLDLSDEQKEFASFIERDETASKTLTGELSELGGELDAAFAKRRAGLIKRLTEEREPSSETVKAIETMNALGAARDELSQIELD